MIVADANLVVYLFVPGERTDQAAAVLRAEPEWCAPLLWRSELGNVLATLVRRGDVALPEALAIAASAESLLAGREYAVASAAVLELAARSGCSAYDCAYVALAEFLGVRLVTTDRCVLEAFPEVAQQPEGFFEAEE